MTEQELTLLKNLQERLSQCESINQVLLEAQNKLINWIDSLSGDLSHLTQNMIYEANDPRLNRQLQYPHILSAKETIDKLIHEKKSLVRFGDGEFATIAGKLRATFQTETDTLLASRLSEVLHSDDDNILLSIADNYGDLSCYTPSSQREIRYYMTPEVRNSHYQLLDMNKSYYNAYLTRPYIMYADNQTDAPKNRFKHLQCIWENRDCIFIEGEQTRMGVGNDLFSNTRSIRRILGPAKNAFRSYEKLLSAAMQHSKDTLLLIALGPTATVLAYDLAMAGYQAIDIGHIDLEYEWFLRGKGCRTEVPLKYNNEFPNGTQVQSLHDPIYESQIIAHCL